MSDQITYTIPGDPRLRKASRSIIGTRGWIVQGCRQIEDPKPVAVDTAEPEVRRGRPRKTEADADQA